jgi:hypothetical protein
MFVVVVDEIVDTVAEVGVQGEDKRKRHVCVSH